mmetsp:Transcript_21320/g.70678  ORF Transcript_21320/g.70678 Transcript_21320/m.70678 type:complete len:169 (-) Transcript_21320:59-565(-)
MSDSTNSATERPKRDAAKKFLNGDAAVKTEPKKPDASPSSSRPARKGTKDTKENKDSKDGGTSKRTAEKSSSGASSSNNAGEAEKKKRMQENLPKITVDKGIRRLDVAALKKYKRHFGLKTGPTSNNKEDLQAAVIRHFANLKPEAGRIERNFLKLIKEQKGNKSEST